METRKSLPSAFWNAVQSASVKLEQNLKNQIPEVEVSLAPLRVARPSLNDPDLFLKEALDYLVLHRENLPHLFWEFTALFFLHIMILPILPITERARRHHKVLDEDLVDALVETFLPNINLVMAAIISKTNRFVDIDGRIFTCILRFAISDSCLRTNAFEELVGSGISSRLKKVWRSANAPAPDLTKLATRFPNHEDSEPSSPLLGESTTSFTLLPFHNQIFDDELAAVHVTVADQPHASSSTRLEFSTGIPFSDTKHWHAHRRTILPKHLGGEGVKDTGERARQKQLRRDQRFMVQMQRLAATLTGASGRMLQQIVIPSTGRKVSEIVDDSPVGKPKQDRKVR